MRDTKFEWSRTSQQNQGRRVTVAQPSTGPSGQVMAIGNCLNPSQSNRISISQQSVAYSQSRYPSPPETPRPAIRTRMELQTPVLPHPGLDARLYQTREPSRAAVEEHDRELREPRPKYTAEQCYFIWYWRIDKKKPWEGREGVGEGVGDGVVERYNAYFSPQRPCQGLQCRYYRFLEEKNVPPIRKRSKSGPDRFMPKYGMVEFTKGKLKYPWMEPEMLVSPQAQSISRPWEL
ncbi:hypothetical protein L228DRAFT_268945 [Xylona heveae TC161]|uniref:Uncharacterized protein n=1 Tax=Xylona heveae (strain CBS 132557 / TC161) TaxID=1328760 RepID=A0A165FWG5_XYLHT|nr:hypothetical protein L228DRAFT_268945 [Xylona heveae TC161]KZF21466.1 hypothetical protein L228DRAFT_268945 [Xylona heveae TC161]